jgi:vacuolar-type H+-ATPase subunit I/STV1
MTQFEMAQYLFSDFGIQVTKFKPTKTVQLPQVSQNHKIQEALERELQHAKKELAQIKKAHRGGKCNADEVFDYEWRVHEIKQQLEQLSRGDFEDFDQNF